MKILHVITDSNIGGAGRCLLNLAEHIPGIHVALPENALLAPALRALSAEVIETKYLAETSFDIRAIRGLISIFKKIEPDIVHTHGAFSGRVAAKACKVPAIIATRHSVFDVPPGYKRFPKKQLTGCLNNFFCDAFIAVSPAAASNLLDLGVPEKKIHVVYNGVKPIQRLPSEARDASKRGLGLSPGDFIIVIAARLVPEKGHDVVLDAMKIISHDKNDGVKCVIAGAGPTEGYIKRRIADERIANVICAGFMEDAGKIFNIADIVVNASYGTEATSLSLLEGMSLGLPAVVSDYGGNPHVITNGENGLVFATNDADALARNIIKLRNDRALYDTMSRNALRVYNERFTAKIMAEQTMKVYET